MRFNLTTENQKVLYELKLHESQMFELEYLGELIVSRVPGGWIYQYPRLDAKTMWAVFVPFNNEFQLVQ